LEARSIRKARNRKEMYKKAQDMSELDMESERKGVSK